MADTLDMGALIPQEAEDLLDEEQREDVVGYLEEGYQYPESIVGAVLHYKYDDMPLSELSEKLDVPDVTMRERAIEMGLREGSTREKRNETGSLEEHLVWVPERYEEFVRKYEEEEDAPDVATAAICDILTDYSITDIISSFHVGRNAVYEAREDDLIQHILETEDALELAPDDLELGYEELRSMDRPMETVVAYRLHESDRRLTEIQVEHNLRVDDSEVAERHGEMIESGEFWDDDEIEEYVRDVVPEDLEQVFENLVELGEDQRTAAAAVLQYNMVESFIPIQVMLGLPEWYGGIRDYISDEAWELLRDQSEF